MTHLDTLLKQATDPASYDAPDTEWVIENGKDSSRQDIYREYFSPYRPDWLGKDVLDVGSGAGWLLNFFMQNGARSVQGIESSRKNVKASSVLYPNVSVICADFMTTKFDSQFDFITVVMVLTNIFDLEVVFRKLRSLMRDEAKLVVIVPDYEYFKTPRHGYELDIAEINSQEYVIETTRPNSVLTDIVRKNDVYVVVAKASGLELIDSIPMIPTEAFSSQLVQYSEFRDQPIMHLLRFTK